MFFLHLILYIRIKTITNCIYESSKNSYFNLCTIHFKYIFRNSSLVRYYLDKKFVSVPKNIMQKIQHKIHIFLIIEKDHSKKKSIICIYLFQFCSAADPIWYCLETNLEEWTRIKSKFQCWRIKPTALCTGVIYCIC